jgi:hypothetical protein
LNRHTARRRTVATIALLAPVLVVQGFRAVSGWNVADSSASVARPVEQAAPAPVQPAPLSNQAKRVQEWLTARGPIDIKRSPMDHPPPVKAAQQPEPVEAEPAPDPKTVVKMPTNKYQLSAIVGGGSTNMASISGKIYRLGEDIETGWTIISIQPRRMIVVLSGPDGQVVELSRNGMEPR